VPGTAPKAPEGTMMVPESAGAQCRILLRGTPDRTHGAMAGPRVRSELFFPPSPRSILREKNVHGLSEAVRRILDRAPTRVLPLTVLEERMREDGVAGRHPPAGLVRYLEEDGGFRIVTPFRGPWARLPEGQPHGSRRRRGEGPVPSPMWILARSPTPPVFGSRERALGRIREGVGAWGEALDRESPASVARWIRANRRLDVICRVLQGGSTEGT
jgi:hypothetical protein